MSSTQDNPPFGSMVDDVAARARCAATLRKDDTIGTPPAPAGPAEPPGIFLPRIVTACALVALTAALIVFSVPFLENRNPPPETLPQTEFAPQTEPARIRQEEFAKSAPASAPTSAPTSAPASAPAGQDLPAGPFLVHANPPYPALPASGPTGSPQAQTPEILPDPEPSTASPIPADEPPAATDEPGTPPLIRHVVTIEPGDSLLGIIGNHEVPNHSILAAVAGLTPTFDPSALHVGDKLAFVLETPTRGDDDEAPSTLLELAILPRSASKSGHHWQGAPFDSQRVIEVVDGVAELRIPQTPKKSARYITGSVRSNFYQAAITAGASTEETLAMISILEGSLDFSRDVRQRDRFEALIEGNEGTRSSVRYVSFAGSQRSIAYYLADFADGSSGHYDAGGSSYENLLDFKPLGDTRVTSGYGFRIHPIRKTLHLHRGTDFRARHGTPIPAAGAGVIVERGWRGGYGRYLRVRHNGRYMTAYAHMKSFAKGTSIGARIKRGQTIGYVGSSGMSTGPHLHFEVLVDGRHANPQKLGRVHAPRLEGDRLAAFHQLTQNTDTLVNRMRIQKVAKAAESELP